MKAPPRYTQRTLWSQGIPKELSDDTQHPPETLKTKKQILEKLVRKRVKKRLHQTQIPTLSEHQRNAPVKRHKKNATSIRKRVFEVVRNIGNNVRNSTVQVATKRHKIDIRKYFRKTGKDLKNDR